MSRIVSLALSVIFVGVLSGESFRLHLLFTNNIHGAIHEVPARFINPEFSPILSGGAGAYTYVNQLRKEAMDSGDFVLLTAAGNFFQGNSSSSYWHGAWCNEFFRR